MRREIRELVNKVEKGFDKYLVGILIDGRDTFGNVVLFVLEVIDKRCASTVSGMVKVDAYKGHQRVVTDQNVFRLARPRRCGWLRPSAIKPRLTSSGHAPRAGTASPSPRRPVACWLAKG